MRRILLSLLLLTNLAHGVGLHVAGKIDQPNVYKNSDGALVIPAVPADSNGNAVSPGFDLSVDAFGRMRVSQPETIFASKSLYEDDSLAWSTSLSGVGASATFDANFSSLTLTAGTASGSTATSRTRTYFQYQPGKGQHFTMTGNFHGGTANVVKEIGAFDEYNGVFFRLSGTSALSLVIRSNTSGSVVDTVIPRASWDDPLDGTGRSGYSIDLQTAQIFGIDYQWLGVGTVRWFVQADKAPVLVHARPNTNRLLGVYMKRPNLPVSYSIYTVGTAAASYLTRICAEVSSEGGFTTESKHTGAPIRLTPIQLGSGVTYPIVSYRIRSSFSRGTSSRPHKGWVMGGSASAAGVTRMCFNCQVSGGTWISITNTALEYNASQTAVTLTNTGAMVFDAGGVTNAGGPVELGVPAFFFGNFDFSQTVADVWTLVLTTLTNNDTWTGGITADQFE